VIALNPADPLLRFTYGGLAGIENAAGRFEDALTWARRAFAVNPNYAAAYWQLSAANAQLGRLDVARRHVESLKTLPPSTTLERIDAGQPTRNGHTRNMLEGLAYAGLP
jgi:tetratricopeptide (TPR) repeat protein